MSTLRPLNLDIDRLTQLQYFINQSNFQGYRCQFLSGDASLRKYYRLGEFPDSHLVMDAPFPENPEKFKYIAEILLQKNFSAPRIVKENLDLGFLLIEDFGDTTYTKALTADNTERLYTLAVDTLIALHQRLTVKPQDIKDYSVPEHLREAQIFIDWFYPKHHQNQHPSAAIKASFVSVWQAALETTMTGPCSLVLRDFHVDNLMLLSDRSDVQQCGLLDFQDALWGSVTYDLVSLLEDARLDVDPLLAAKLWQHYGAAFPDYDLNELKRIGTIISAVRHTKIIGIFTRLADRDGKTQYLPHLPRVWRHLNACLSLPDLAPVKAWFDHHIPGWSHLGA